jgi:pSer/pThr/pTyr-binding forkhead associated (FHA) protein
MAKLVLSSGGAILHQCFIDERVAIGRQADNEVVIEDPAVDAKHAAVLAIGNDHIVEDLESANGTFVNGTRISRHILQHGDVIQLGSFYLRYLNPRASAEADLERTMIIRGIRGVAAAAMQPTRRVQEPVIASVRPTKVRFPKGRVRVIAGPRAGETVALDRVIAIFGKPGEELAVITRRPRGYFVTHVEGRRVPRLNAQSIGVEARALRDGDVIEVGDEKLELMLD